MTALQAPPSTGEPLTIGCMSCNTPQSKSNSMSTRQAVAFVYMGVALYAADCQESTMAAVDKAMCLSRVHQE